MPKLAGTAEAILIAHQRYDSGSCLCGWSELGRSHAGHQVAMLRKAGLLNDAPSDVPVVEATPSGPNRVPAGELRRPDLPGMRRPGEGLAEGETPTDKDFPAASE